MCSNFKTTSPQGDGNPRKCLGLVIPLTLNFKTTSPQGDGNFFLSLTKRRIPFYFKTTSPQGDGNEKGDRLDIFFSLHFKTTSPQGDGNTCAKGAYSMILCRISKPHPRKGTETQLRCMILIRHQHHISKPHPRKGTETGNRNRHSIRKCPPFQNHIPARGRKHPTERTERINPDWNFKTTSPQGDGTHEGRLHEAKTSYNRLLIFLQFFRLLVTFATERGIILNYNIPIDDRCFQLYRWERY